jgi:hypothetical protein
MKILKLQKFTRLKNEKFLFFLQNPESVQTFDGRFLKFDSGWLRPQ